MYSKNTRTPLKVEKLSRQGTTARGWRLGHARFDQNIFTALAMMLRTMRSGTPVCSAMRCPSKEALAAEAFASAANRGLEPMTADRDGRPATLTDFLDYYLSFDHRDNLATSCPMSASASEVGRQDKVVCERFTEGFEQLVAQMERGLGDSPVKAEDRQRALAIMAAMIGGVAASRAVAKTDLKLSN